MSPTVSPTRTASAPVRLASSKNYENPPTHSPSSLHLRVPRAANFTVATAGFDVVRVGHPAVVHSHHACSDPSTIEHRGERSAADAAGSNLCTGNLCTGSLCTGSLCTGNLCTGNLRTPC
jgi:hypothetical protein